MERAEKNRSTLALFMTGICADHADDVLAFDDTATFAKALD